MTSRRRRTRNTSNESTDMKMPRKRGRSDGSPTSSAAAVIPPEASHEPRKNPNQTSPSEVSPEVPPRKTRRGATTPDTPRRTSPRGHGGSSPGAKDSALMLKGRGRRNRRESTDSSASSVGNISVASSSTSTQRRSRRGSSSSGVSATSENSQVTSTRQTGKGRKRNKSNSPPSVALKKTNGTSPQYSVRSTKRRKGTAQVETSLSAANGCSGRKTRGKGYVSETLPQKNRDGGAEDHESSHLKDCENSTLPNSLDGFKVAKLETPEFANSTSDSIDAVLEGEQEVGKLENFQNVSDMCDNSEKDHTLQKNESEENSEEKVYLCRNEYSNEHQKDYMPDSDILQPNTVPVAICGEKYNKNHKEASSLIVSDSGKEISEECSDKNISSLDSKNKYSEKYKSVINTKSECENECRFKLEGTDVSELHSENKYSERHEGTDNSILKMDSKKEYSAEHQSSIIPTLGCKSENSKKHSNTNILISDNESDKNEMHQNSNNPVSKYERGNMCSLKHDYVSSSNSIAGEHDSVTKRRLDTSRDAELRTCNSDTKCEVSDLSTTCSTNSSSRVQSAKRRQSSGESFESESLEVRSNAPKKVKLSNIVPDVPDSLADGSRGKDSVIAKYERSKETNKSDLDRGKCEGNKKVYLSDCLGCVNEVVKVEVKMECLSKAEALLAALVLTQEQTKEVCSVIPAHVRDSSEGRIVEALVETLLNGSTTVTTMNSPRFNKFLRQLLTHYCSLETTKENKHALCEKAVQWAHDRKSVNLRHELELTLMSLYYNTCHYKQAEVIATSLYSETKKLQDKEKTVKACLCLSKVYHAMGNISKARANITTAKTEALKIYTPPDMQGELDLQSGIMQVAEGKDMETAYSYFKEAATGFTSRRQRGRALKYMLLSKIMVNRPEEGEKAVRSQSHVQDIDEGVEAMLAITSAANRSSLADFRKAREQYGEHLGGDMVVASVLDDLYVTMMEKNLLSIVLPYERLQIVHIADCIGLPREEVERRLSQMILDKRINAQLDHRDDCLYVYATEDSDVVYQSGIDILSQLDKTVSHLNRKVKKLL